MSSIAYGVLVLLGFFLAGIADIFLPVLRPRRRSLSTPESLPSK